MKNKELLIITWTLVFVTSSTCIWAQPRDSLRLHELRVYLSNATVDFRTNHEHFLNYDFTPLIASRDSLVLTDLLRGLSQADLLHEDNDEILNAFKDCYEKTLTQLASHLCFINKMSLGRPLRLGAHYDFSFSFYGIPESNWPLFSYITLARSIINSIDLMAQETSLSNYLRVNSYYPDLHFIEASYYGDDSYMRTVANDCLPEQAIKSLRRFAKFGKEASYFDMVNAIDWQIVLDFQNNKKTTLKKHLPSIAEYFEKVRAYSRQQLLGLLLGMNGIIIDTDLVPAEASLEGFIVKTKLERFSIVIANYQTELENLKRIKEQYSFPDYPWNESSVLCESEGFHDYYSLYVQLLASGLKYYLVVGEVSGFYGELAQEILLILCQTFGFQDFGMLVSATATAAFDYWYHYKDIIAFDLIEDSLDAMRTLGVHDPVAVAACANVFIYEGMTNRCKQIIEEYLMPDLLQFQDGGNDDYNFNILHSVLITMNLIRLAEDDRYYSELSKMESLVDKLLPEIKDLSAHSYFESLLANYYESSGDFEKCISLCNKLKASNSYTSKDIDLLMAYAYYRSGRYDDALTTFETMDGMPEPEHFEYLASAIVTYSYADNPHVKDFIPLYLEGMKERFTRRFMIMREEDRESMCNYFRKETLPIMQALLRKPGDNKITCALADLLYNWSLLSKGLLLQSNRQIEYTLLNHPDSNVRTTASKMKELALLIDNMTISGEPVNDIVHFKSQYEHFSNTVVSIIRNDPSIVDINTHLSTTWRDIHRHLDDQTAAIEFVEIPAENKSNVYVALLLRKEDSEPIPVILGSDSEIKNIIGSLDGRRVYSSFASTRLYKLFWERLEPYLSQTRRIAFSVDGYLHQMNLEVLRDSNNKMACEKWELFRLSSTRELCQGVFDNKVIRSAVLYGGLNYHMDETESTDILEKYSSSTSGGKLRGSSLPAKIPDAPLPETLSEIETIESMLKEQNVIVKPFTGNEGVEESFKMLSGGNYDLIHMATHGFFMEGVTEYQKDSDDILSPMLRSGLVLSRGTNQPDDSEDGLLLAREIADMDLSHTSLFVMSACETGKGEITGDGVFGLQRGLKQAGVGSIIMTLWKVDSEVAQVFMTALYSSYVSSGNLYSSFQIAREKARNFAPTSDWSAFILLD